MQVKRKRSKKKKKKTGLNRVGIFPGSNRSFIGDGHFCAIQIAFDDHERIRVICAFVLTVPLGRRTLIQWFGKFFPKGLNIIGRLETFHLLDLLTRHLDSKRKGILQKANRRAHDMGIRGNFWISSSACGPLTNTFMETPPPSPQGILPFPVL